MRQGPTFPPTSTLSTHSQTTEQAGHRPSTITSDIANATTKPNISWFSEQEDARSTSLHSFFISDYILDIATGTTLGMSEAHTIVVWQYAVCSARVRTQTEGGSPLQCRTHHSFNHLVGSKFHLSRVMARIQRGLFCSKIDGTSSITCSLAAALTYGLHVCHVAHTCQTPESSPPQGSAPPVCSPNPPRHKRPLVYSYRTARENGPRAS